MNRGQMDSTKFAIFSAAFAVAILIFGLLAGNIFGPEPLRNIRFEYDTHDLVIANATDVMIESASFPIRTDVEYELRLLPPDEGKNHTIDICFNYVNITLKLGGLDRVDTKQGWDCFGHIFKHQREKVKYTFTIYVGGNPENQTMKIILVDPFPYSTGGP